MTQAFAPGGLRLGTSTVDITPSHPVELAGFAARTGPFTSIGSRLELQAFAFASRDSDTVQAILVCADLLWWGNDSRLRITAAVSAALGVSADAVVLHASHTHAAPHTEPAFSSQLGKVDEDYVAELERRTVAACCRAAESLVPVELSIAHGWCDAGVARRGGGPHRGPMRVDRDASVDGAVRLITARREDGRVHAGLVHFGCHPVTVQGNTVSADFPGVARRQLRRLLGEHSTVAMLQSCSGDVNPAILADGQDFRAGSDTDAEVVGSALADAAETALTSGERPLDVDRIGVARAEADLPLCRVAEPSGGVWAELAERRAARPPAVTVPKLVLSGLRLGDVTLVGMNAEVTTEVGQALAATTPEEVLPLTCSDGMIGYLVGPGDLTRGGYEAEESYAFVYRSGPFGPEALSVAQQTLRRLLHTVA